MTSTETGPRAGRREWTGLAVLALPCLLVSMDLTVLNLAVPQLSADLRPSGTQLLWIVDIYGFMIASSLILMGSLGDRTGRRRLLMVGAAAFGAASLLAAASTSAEMLIASRALLGVAGATLMPSTLALIRNMFHDPAQRTTAIGIWTAAFSLGGVLGPLVGGVLLQYFWWGSVFLLGVPVMALVLLLSPALVPEYRSAERTRFDLVSAALTVVAVLLVIYGMKRFAETGADLLAAIAAVAGVVLGVWFVRRQLRMPHPLVDIRLFRIPAVGVSLAVNTGAFFVAFGSLLLIAQYLQLVVGLSPLAAGLWTVPSALGFVLGAMVAPMLTRLTRPGNVMALGMAVSALGFALLTQVRADSGLTIVVAAGILFFFGVAPAYIIATDLIVSGAPPERAGGASAVSEAGTEFGSALGIAVLGTIAVAVYRGSVDGPALAGLPADMVETVRRTLGGATSVAEQLPAPQDIQLTELARAAFAQALGVSAAVSALLAAAMAVVCAVVLRRTPGAPAGEPGAATSVEHAVSNRSSKQAH
ncbi:MFS transporter [Micromonospora sp. LOL_021]|uniref:MFS transporter n=1 Tax=Micromonospora sp. LOL_021 TaxID=3345417 RepID=UPI003A864965